MNKFNGGKVNGSSFLRRHCFYYSTWRLLTPTQTNTFWSLLMKSLLFYRITVTEPRNFRRILCSTSWSRIYVYMYMPIFHITFRIRSIKKTRIILFLRVHSTIKFRFINLILIWITKTVESLVAVIFAVGTGGQQSYLGLVSPNTSKRVYKISSLGY